DPRLLQGLFFRCCVADLFEWAIVSLTDHHGYNLDLVEFLLGHAIDRIAAILPVDFKEQARSDNVDSVAAMILQKGGKQYEKEVHEFFKSMKDTWRRFNVGVALVEYDAAKYGTEGLKAARASFSRPQGESCHNTVAEWMLKQFGNRVL